MSNSTHPLLRVLSELYNESRLLVLAAAVNAVLAVAFTVLMQVDGRMLLGRNIWTKPWKFATSIAIFTATMAWLLPTLSLGQRTRRRISTVIATAMMIEITLISTQAARGVRSHFNAATALDGTISVVMVLTITINTVVVGYALWRAVREPPTLAPAPRLGVQLGLLLFVLASLEGMLMVVYGSHSVGVAPDAAGLPLLNWKVSGGDLRIAHFLGLHGLQILPLAGLVAARRLDRRRSLAAVVAVAVLYGGFTAGTFVQALLGLPFVAGVPTLPAGAGVATLVAACLTSAARFGKQ